MTLTMDLLEANLPELARQVKDGDTVILTEGTEKTPVLRIEAVVSPGNDDHSAVAGRAARRLGFLADLKLDIPDSFFFDPLPEEELRLWEGGDADDQLFASGSR